MRPKKPLKRVTAKGVFFFVITQNIKGGGKTDPHPKEKLS
jgi:hypothetical protein